MITAAKYIISAQYILYILVSCQALNVRVCKAALNAKHNLQNMLTNRNIGIVPVVVVILREVAQATVM